MSRIESEARALLLRRRESLQRSAAEALRADPAASWRDWEWQPERMTEPARRELAEIDDALKRIDAGTYGTCVSCGGPMGFQRIRAVPEARFCLSCAGRSELPD